MWIRSASVKNYKPFHASGRANFSPGFNAIVGQNNAGKSALLEALDVSTYRAKPHFSPLIKSSHPVDGNSVTALRVVFSGEELAQLVADSDRVATIPSLSKESHDSIAEIFGETSVIFEFVASGGTVSPLPSSQWNLDPFPKTPSAKVTSVTARMDVNTGRIRIGATGGGRQNSLAALASTALYHSLFVFKAERLNVGSCDVPPNDDPQRLRPNAANLAAMIHKLQANRDEMDEYVHNVSSIIPNVKNISVDSMDRKFVIKVSPSYSTRKRNFTLELNDCGTGLSQVLAIVFAIMKTEGGVIIVDEPNSFLHPGASKALIDTMRRYPSSQYILSTHSPEIISAARPETVVAVRRREHDSELVELSGGDVSDIRDVLADIGASLGDVFGLEHLIWVEGETERELFPVVAESFKIPLKTGLAFVPMRTSEVSGRGPKAKVVADLHQRIGTASVVLPTTVSFSFDSEGRGQGEKDDIIRTLEGRAIFLPRRMIENYLLSAPAIAAVLRQVSPAAATTTAEDVWSWAKATKVPLERLGPGSEDPLVKTADAVDILKGVFWDLGKVEFMKTRHAVMLLREILQDDPKSLGELRDHVRALCKL